MQDLNKFLRRSISDGHPMHCMKYIYLLQTRFLKCYIVLTFATEPKQSSNWTMCKSDAFAHQVDKDNSNGIELTEFLYWCVVQLSAALSGHRCRVLVV